MELNTRQAVLVAISLAGGQVSGKTYLQKLCFFIGVKTGLALGFSPHYYGPYSALVASEVSFLKGAGYISEVRCGSGVADSRGWEMARYDYCITPKGRDIVKGLEQTNPGDVSTLRNVVSEIKQAGDLDYVGLSIAAKTYWIVNDKHGVPATTQAVAEQASQLNWQLSTDQVSAAADFLERLSLVKKL